MIFVKSQEFRNRMHHYMQKVMQGHRIIITLHGEPVGELSLPSFNNVVKTSVPQSVQNEYIKRVG